MLAIVTELEELSVLKMAFMFVMVQVALNTALTNELAALIIGEVFYRTCTRVIDFKNFI